MKNFLTYFLSCILTLATCFSFAQETKAPATNKKIDSLLHILITFSPPTSDLKPAIENENADLQMDTTKINTLNELSKQYCNIGSYGKALQYAIQAGQKGEKLITLYKDSKAVLILKKGIATAYNNSGVVYKKQGNYEKAMDNYLKSLKIYEEIGYKKGIANCYNNIGLIYRNQGTYEKAIENLLKSLKIRESLGDNEGIAYSLCNIGNVYINQKDYEKALKFYLNSLKIVESISGEKISKANLLNNIGLIYSEWGNYKKALDYQSRALEIEEKCGDKSGIAHSYTSIGEIYGAQAESDTTGKSLDKGFKKAMDNFLKALEINLEIEDIQGASINYGDIGTIYLKQGKLKESFNYETKSLTLSKEIGYKEGIKEAYSSLSALYEKQSDYQHAFEFQKLFSEIKDTLLNEQSGKQIAEMNARYESEKKDKEIQLLNKEKESQATLAAAEKRKQQVILFSVSGFSILLMGFAMIIFGSYRQKERLNIELESSKKSIEQKNLKIIDSITYAQLIQQSILMEESEIQRYLPDSFIYYQPKDIVSGDFYWFSKVNDVLILAAIDCTGHGVPGAFMSMIGNTLLNQIVNEKQNTKPSEILLFLNIGIYEALHQQNGGVLSHDGMDMALCSIDYTKGEVHYAGAQNPLYVVSENNLEVIKADMHTIGGGGSITSGFDPSKRTYTNHIIPIKKGMSLYLFSDGYMDQFGKQDRKKFGIQQFKNLLLSNQHLNMQQQKEKIVEAFEDWKGASPQIDDVLVMGLRL